MPQQYGPSVPVWLWDPARGMYVCFFQRNVSPPASTSSAIVASAAPTYSPVARRSTFTVFDVPTFEKSRSTKPTLVIDCVSLQSPPSLRHRNASPACAMTVQRSSTVCPEMAAHCTYVPSSRSVGERLTGSAAEPNGPPPSLRPRRYLRHLNVD